MNGQYSGVAASSYVEAFLGKRSRPRIIRSFVTYGCWLFGRTPEILPGRFAGGYNISPMNVHWTDRRCGYHYPGFMFSEDGTLAREGEVEYREQPFSASARKRFNIWLAIALLMVFPGIPLLAYWNLLDRLLWIVVIAFGLIYWLHQRIHDCPGCGGKSRVLRVSHMGAPVLYLCPRCLTFFEHGEIDGGWPWK